MVVLPSAAFSLAAFPSAISLAPISLACGILDI
jgi:hypothetical protein